VLWCLDLLGETLLNYSFEACPRYFTVHSLPNTERFGGKLLVTWLSFLIDGSNPTIAVEQPALAERPSKVAETEDLGINSINRYSFRGNSDAKGGFGYCRRLYAAVDACTRCENQSIEIWRFYFTLK